MTIFIEIQVDIGEMLTLQKWRADYNEKEFYEKFKPSDEQKREYAKTERRFAELRRKYGL
uniref:Uncharacterized protein n=1 Tax=viral metagenome TaxID=1070528 RepID=A0A6H1ZSF7_9ZZZZ